MKNFSGASFFPWSAVRDLVPWPADARSAPLNPSLAMLCALADGALSCLRLGYVLSCLSPEDAENMLREAGRCARVVLAADFRLAERNMETPSAVLAGFAAMAGTAFRKGGNAVFACAREYMRRGGLEGLARAAGMEITRRRSLLGGAAVLAYGTFSPVAVSGRAGSAGLWAAGS